MRTIKWVVALVAIAFIAGCASAPGSFESEEEVAGPTYDAGEIVFRYVGDADTVVLAGSFTGWGPDDENWLMEQTDDGFEITVELPAGTHQYKYVIDGEWTEPTSIPELIEPTPSGQTGDGFDGFNAVLVVE